MIEAGAPSTEEVVAEQEMPTPPGLVILPPQTIQRNTSKTRSVGHANENRRDQIRAPKDSIKAGAP
jgi:hypothetical protein